jgi:hypothetical protein
LSDEAKASSVEGALVANLAVAADAPSIFPAPEHQE